MSGEMKRILVADDDRSALKLMEAALRVAGFSVTLAGDGEQALTLFHGAQFDLVMLDIDMPGRTGLEVCEELRREAGDLLPIVMVTGMDDVESVDAAYRAGATDFISKPISWALIAHRVRYMLRGYQINLDLQAARESNRRLAYFDSLTGAPNREYFQHHPRRRRWSGTAASSARSRCCASTWTTSSASTTRWAMASATSCCAWSRGACARELRSGGRPARPTAPTSTRACARLGGDEFMVLLPDVGTVRTHAGAVADRLIAAVSQPMRLAKHEVLVTPSIGVAHVPRRRRGRARRWSAIRTWRCTSPSAAQPGSAAFFEAEMSAAALKRLTIEGELRGAIERNELSVEYQPQYQLGSARIVGMEALLRWKHPSLGAVPPAEFVPIAEQTGLIFPIGEWVLRTACAQVQRLAARRAAAGARGGECFGPAAGAAGVSRDSVARVLAETQLQPSLLELEITETVIVQDDVRAIRAIRELQALGVEIAIDDFGTGHSSFARLSRFPVNRLKIDRAFVQRAHLSSADSAIAAAMISMAQDPQHRGGRRGHRGDGAADPAAGSQLRPGPGLPAEPAAAPGGRTAAAAARGKEEQSSATQRLRQLIA